MTAAPGVWVTGPSRTGTSLTAGLFVAHGVFFGNTGEGDEFNRKGYFEHPLLVEAVEGEHANQWPAAWWARLRAEGWNGKEPWGCKRGPKAWPWAATLDPTVIVITTRPRSQIEASRKRWGRFSQTRRALTKARRQLARIQAETSIPIVTVNTDAIVKGDYSRILPAFRLLGIPFNQTLADEWIDPSLWNRGG
jgi:hypothetical protein